MFEERSIAGWAVLLLALLLFLAGLWLIIGGAWLIALGGSWYYFLAGLGLVISGVMITLDRPAGVWLYLATFLATIAWAFWEVGLDGWALVPRVVGPSIFAFLVLAALPVISHRASRVKGDAP